MAGSKTDWFEKALLDFLFGGGTLTVPTTWYVALSTAAYVESGTGASMNEVPTASTGYGRAAAGNNSTNFLAASGSGPTTKTTGAAITFGGAGPNPWGTVVSFYLCDTTTPGTGNAWYGGDLQASKTIANGDTASFASGQLSITED
jgi:hypothetical protein